MRLENFNIALIDWSLRLEKLLRGYIDKMSWLLISKNLYISENGISKYKRKGIEEIIQMYEMGTVAM